MGDDSVTFTVSMEAGPRIFVLAKDVIVVSDDGTIGVLKKGTKLTVPWPDGPVTVDRNE